MVMIYLPLACFVLILLFPFYWMTMTAFKPNAELLQLQEHNPFWITSPTLEHIKHLLFKTVYPSWLKTTMMVAVGSTFLSLFASTLAAYAIQRLRFQGSQYVGLGDLPRLSGAAVDPVHSAGDDDRAARPVRQPDGADPGVSDLPGPVLHLAADRLLQVDPLRARGMRAGRRRHAAADPAPDHAAAGGARPDLAPASSPSRCPGTSSSTRSPSSRAARTRRCRSRS